jgi:Peptidase A4 family
MTSKSTSVRSVRRAALALVPAVLAVAPSAAAATTVGQAPLLAGAGSVSSNWSGYASQKGPFTSVSASWVQPAGSCTSARTYSSFWVGLDGDGSNTVEQTGSEVDCRSGKPVYYAWYEMFPAFPVNYPGAVHPGDHISASVTAAGSRYTLVLSDVTQGWSKTTVKTLASAKKHSAEVIAEAPSSSGGVLPLTNFGTVGFTAALANGTPIGNIGGVSITMKSGTTLKAQPSALTSGQNFTVTWHHS